MGAEQHPDPLPHPHPQDVPTRGPARRRRALAGAAAAAALLLAGCSGAGEGSGEAGAQEAGPASGAAPASSPATVARLDLGDRLDQRMSEAAAARAASFGFDRQGAATPEEVATAREATRARATDSARTTVEPAECKAPLAALDFSPILLDQEEVTRVDVGAPTLAGTGTVEVAVLDGRSRQRVERHLQTVNALLADCRQMDMTVTEDGTATDFRLTTRAPELSDGSPAQSGLVWQRSLASADGPQLTAQVLTAVTADAVVMVSFTGQPAVGDRQFTLMAEEILAAAVTGG